MTPPYASQPLDALMVVHTSAGLVVGALAVRRVRPAMAAAVFCSAVLLAVVAPVAGSFFAGIGVGSEPLPAAAWLKAALVLCVGGVLLTRRRALAAVAAAGSTIAWLVVGYIRDSDGDLAGAVLAWFGLLVGLFFHFSPALRPASGAEEDPGPRISERTEDLLIFALGTAAGAAVCAVILHGWTASGDEWADTYQAALFAHLRAYGTVPPCAEALRPFWVFFYMGRAFAQYTPGWPLFMAPFVALHAAWLAGPASLGLLAVAVARLARRGAGGVAAGDPPPSFTEIRAAGRFAVLLVLLSSTLLINGGARYPHLFEVAVFAWATELLLALASPDVPRRDARIGGAWLGACAAMLLATRPLDGVTLGFGLLAYFVYALVRRRISWVAVVAALAGFAALAGLSLVILRLQLGRWFATGYDVGHIVYPWVKNNWSVPKANEWGWGIPFAFGSYCWFPCTPSVGLAGMAALRGSARKIAFILFCSCFALVAAYTSSELGRGHADGYGPRYQLPLVVPMAVGTAVVLAQLYVGASARLASGQSPLQTTGPLVVALTALLLGVVRVAPYIYPYTYAVSQAHNRLHSAIAAANLHDALVFGGGGLNDTDARDLPENLPIELYPDQDVIIALDLGGSNACVRNLYPNRRAFRAVPGNPVRLVPEP